MSEPFALPEALRQLLERPGPIALLLRLPAGSDWEALQQALIAAFPGRSFLLGGTGGDPSSPSRSSDFDRSIAPATMDQAARIRNAWSRLVRGPLSPREEVSDFLWLPGAFQEAWSRMGPDPEPVMLVIRRWEEWMGDYLGTPPGPLAGFPDLNRLQLLLLRQMTRRPIHLVFLEEDPGGSSLELTVDAVVSLGSDLSQGRLERLQRGTTARRSRPHARPSGHPPKHRPSH